MNLSKKELNFLVDFFSHWANPFRSFSKLDIFRRGNPFGGPYDIDLEDLIQKDVLSESPDGHQVRLTDLGYELMVRHMRSKKEWSRQKIIRANFSKKNEVMISKGEYFKGYEVIRKILLTAEESLQIQDPYIGPDIFSILHELRLKKIKIMVGSKPYKERASAIVAYNRLKREVDTMEMRSSSEIHNRYIIIDNKTVYQVGGSIKQLGDKDDVIRKIDKASKILTDFESDWRKAEKIESGKK